MVDVHKSAYVSWALSSALGLLIPGPDARVERQIHITEERTMKRINLILAVCLLWGAPVAGSAAIITMNFEGLGLPDGVGSYHTAPYTEGGMTVNNPSAGADAHIDINGSNVPEWTGLTGTHALGLHEGNNGSHGLFTYAGGNFDLISFDIIGWQVGGNPNAPTELTVTSSAGGVLILDPADFGTIDFTSVSGFSDISWLRMVMPNPELNCDLEICYGVGIDQLVYGDDSVVPTPTPWALFVFGLAGVRFLRKSPPEKC